MEDTDKFLLQRLGSLDDHEAWQEFFDRYWALIVSYATRIGLSRSHADEVLQETMVSMMRTLPGFNYDRDKGRFRGYLRKVVNRTSYRLLGRERARQTVTIEAVPEYHQTDPKPDAAEQLEESDDNQKFWQESLFAAALKTVYEDSRIDERTRRVFQAYAIENRPVTVVADEFGHTPNAVYQIKNRLMRRIKIETERLRREADGLLE